MDAKKNKQLYTKEEFNSKIKELYANSADKPVAELRRAVAEFYSKFTADEDTLFERYRELKYQLEQSCPIGLSMYVSLFTSVFVASAVKYIEESVLLKGLLLMVAGGLLTYALGSFVIRRARNIYMKKKILLVYPLEIELLEQQLLQDTNAEAPVITTAASSPDDFKTQQK